MPKTSTVSDRQLDKFFGRFKSAVRSTPITSTQLTAVIGRKTQKWENAFIHKLENEVFEATGTATVRVSYNIDLVEIARLAQLVGSPFKIDPLLLERLPRHPDPVVQVEPFSRQEGYCVDELFQISEGRLVDPLVFLYWASRYMMRFNFGGPGVVAAWRDHQGSPWLSKFDVHGGVIEPAGKYMTRVYGGDLAQSNMYMCAGILMQHKP